MPYFLGSTSNSNEFLLLKNNKKITFSLNTKSIPGTKKYFNSNYLNVVNPDNTIYNLEQDIELFVHQTYPEYHLRSNIIFNNKQFVQFKVEDDLVVNPNTNLSIDVEIDKIKFNHENKFYSVMLRVTSVGIKYFQKKY
jgi:hypothetical protein